MPSTSKKQHNFMAAIANNPSFAKKVGVSQSVGKDFDEADKGRKFGKGGTTQQRINKQDTKHGKLDLPFKQLNRMAGMKGGGSVKKYAKGAIVSEKDYKASGYSTLRDYLNNQQKKTRRGETAEQNEAIQSEALGRRQIANMAKMPKVTDAGGGDDLTQNAMMQYNKKGGSVKESKGMMFMKKKGAPASMMGMKDGGMAMVKKGGKMVPSFAADGKGKMNMGGMAGMKHGGMHKMPNGKMMKDSAMKKMNMGGMSKYAKGGGIEARGKTKGTVIKMAAGGSVGSASRRADGIAQRGKTKFTNY